MISRSRPPSLPPSCFTIQNSGCLHFGIICDFSARYPYVVLSSTCRVVFLHTSTGFTVKFCVPCHHFNHDAIFLLIGERAIWLVGPAFGGRASRRLETSCLGGWISQRTFGRLYSRPFLISCTLSSRGATHGRTRRCESYRRRRARFRFPSVVGGHAASMGIRYPAPEGARRTAASPGRRAGEYRSLRVTRALHGTISGVGAQHLCLRAAGGMFFYGGGGP